MHRLARATATGHDADAMETAMVAADEDHSPSEVLAYTSVPLPDLSDAPPDFADVLPCIDIRLFQMLTASNHLRFTNRGNYSHHWQVLFPVGFHVVSTLPGVKRRCRFVGQSIDEFIDYMGTLKSLCVVPDGSTGWRCYLNALRDIDLSLIHI